MGGGALDRRDCELAERGHVGLADLHAKAERLRLLPPHTERAEQPIPDREAAAEILVEVKRVVRVMDLMVRGREEDAPREPGEGDPEMRVLEMYIDVHEQHQDDVGIVDGEERNRLAE